MRGKFIYIAISIILSIAISYFSFHWTLIIITLLYFIFIKWKLSNLLFVCLMVFILFGAYFYLFEMGNHSKLANTSETIAMTGRIITIPDIDGDKLTTTIKTNQNEKVLLNYRISSEQEKKELSSLSIGMVCQFKGQIKKPPLPRNPYAFHYQKYLYFQQIHWIFTPQKFNPSQCTPTTLSFIEYLQLFRQNEIRYIEQHFPAISASFVEALVYGYRDNMSQSIINSFQSLGTIHILAISGLHVSLVTGMLFYLGLRMGVTNETMFTILLLLIPIYILLAGAAPSVIRAGIMTMIGLCFIKYHNFIPLIDIISITCMIMLVINPYFLFQIGFQLSFLVSCALILSANKIISVQHGYFRQLLTITISAQVIVFPLLLYYFYEISILSLAANLIFVPVFSFIILPLAIIILFIHHLLPSIGEIFIHIFTALIDNITNLSLFLSSFTQFTFVFGKPHPILILLYYIIIIFLFVSWEKRRKLYYAITSLVIVMVIHWNWHSFNPYGTITMIDVGQGDSFLIEFPHRKAVYMIDTGGTVSFNQKSWQMKKNAFSIGKDVLLPFLKGKGIRNIDKLIITHGDQDHMGSLQELLNNIKIDHLYFPIGFHNNKENNEILTKLTLENIPYEFLRNGDKWYEAKTGFFVLSPNGNEGTTNNRSIVLYTKLGGLSWLFTGDLEKDGEEALIANYPNLRVDILKIGHHGSKTSTAPSFVHTLSPKIALISVGENNRFNHPHPDVIEKLKMRNITIFQTNIHGAVQYIFTKEKGTFQTQLP